MGLGISTSNALQDKTQPLGWRDIDWAKVKQKVKEIQIRIAKAEKRPGCPRRAALSMLELCEVKISRTVLRRVEHLRKWVLRLSDPR